MYKFNSGKIKNKLFHIAFLIAQTPGGQIPPTPGGNAPAGTSLSVPNPIGATTVQGVIEIVFPKLVLWILIIAVGYFTIMVSWHYSVLFIPLLLLMWIYKIRGERNGWRK